MISQVEVVPDISDHEAITFQPLNRSPASKLYKVYQYHKVNISEITKEMNNITTSLWQTIFIGNLWKTTGFFLEIPY